MDWFWLWVVLIRRREFSSFDMLVVMKAVLDKRCKRLMCRLLETINKLFPDPTVREGKDCFSLAQFVALWNRESEGCGFKPRVRTGQISNLLLHCQSFRWETNWSSVCLFMWVLNNNNNYNLLKIPWHYLTRGRDVTQRPVPQSSR